MALVLFNAYIQKQFSRGCMTFTMLYFFNYYVLHGYAYDQVFNYPFFLILLYNSDMMNLYKNVNYPACIGRSSCSITVEYILVCYDEDVIGI